MQGKQLTIHSFPKDFMLRYDCFTSDYCDIALEAYYDAMELHEKMEAAEWYLGPIDHQMPDRMKKKMMVAIVFSAMCAESFINDYLSVRLGDHQFKTFNNDNYRYSDKLRIIMMDILNQQDYTTHRWFQDLTELFRKRNSLVHNVSKELTVEQFVRTTHYEDWQSKLQNEVKLRAAQTEFPNDQESQFHTVVGYQNPDDWQENPKPTVADKTKRDSLQNDLNFVQRSLTALSDMTQLIEKLDSKSRAFEHTFSPMALLWGEDEERVIREKVFPKIGLSFTAEDLERDMIDRPKNAPKIRK